MDKGIVLTPEELYYLGTILQARYIDYAYVAAMDDIGQNYNLFEKETGTALVSKGILMEDFSGNMDISEAAAKLLRPIFFGDTETSIDVCEFGKENKISVFKFHFYDGAITMVCGDQGKLLIQSVDQLSMKEQISGMIPEDYRYEAKSVTDLTRESISRFFVFKSAVVGKTAQVKTFIESAGLLYQEKNEAEIETIDREAFISNAYAVIKGV